VSESQFFKDVVIIGSVLGADSTSAPDEVTAIPGADFAENRRSHHGFLGRNPLLARQVHHECQTIRPRA
jgi:hypothetical protein